MIFKRILQRIRKHYYDKLVAPENVEKRFTNIYNSGYWFDNNESKSGSGSTLKATEDIRKSLPNLLLSLDARNLVDLGCGDYYWMNKISLPCNYLGLDIVKSVIKENERKYGNERCSFLHHNAIEENLPDDSDVVLCREVLFHLSFEDGIKLIKNVLQSNSRYLIVTSSLGVKENKDIRSGKFRNINLSRPPYNFPDFQFMLDDKGVSDDRILGVWSISDLRTSMQQ